jgi:predicted phage baseplate assembly protein
MPLDVPNLDDRRWVDLVDEARSLIPRVAPRWTDHNVHDPGITLIELFAWLVEMQIYRLNRVGERHRELFARLAGAARRPRTPARLGIVASGNTTAQTIASGTQIVPLDGDEIVFETATDVTLTRSRIVRVVVDDGSGAVDQTNANEKAGVAFLAFGENPRAGSELRLAFDQLHSEERAIRLTFDVFSADLAGRCAEDGPIPAGDNHVPAEALSPVDLVWEYESEPDRWRSLVVTYDDTIALSRSGTVVLVPPDPLPSVPPQIRCRIVRGQYDIEPRLEHIALNVLPCAQIETIRNESHGRGNARPDQWFALTRGPVLFPPHSEPPVRVEVAGEAWQMKATFDASTPESRHFTFDPRTLRVSFGNGLNGRIPRPGEDIGAAWYQTSSGRAGNVAKGLTWKFRTLTAPGVSLKNPQAAAGGADIESLGDLELRARALLNRPQRAVTLNDMERIVLGTPGVHVARAHALANCPAPESITIVAVPKVRPGRRGPPTAPSNAFLAAVRRHLEPRRLLCDNLRVVRPVYLEVRVSARLRLARNAGAVSVVERARQALDAFLTGVSAAEGPAAMVAGASSPCPTRWPIGRSVFPSDVYSVLDRVEGVEAVASLVLSAARDGKPITPTKSGAIPVPAVGLIFPGAHELGVELESGRGA